MAKKHIHTDNLIKIITTAGILLSALSITYYFVIFLPQKENKKIELQKQELDFKKEEQQKAEQIKQDAQDELNLCLTSASINYNDFWRRECDSQGLLTQKCSHLVNITFSEYMDENPELKIRDASTKYNKEKNDCSCLLPSYNANRVDAQQKEDIDNCYKKFNTLK